MQHKLHSLNLDHNAIDNVKNLKPLTWNRGLRSLTLAPNPFLKVNQMKIK